jgi:hypothetical protein
MIAHDLQRHGFRLAGEFHQGQKTNGRLEFRPSEPVPVSRGTYAWIMDDEVVYVGSAMNLHRRLASEHTGNPHRLEARRELRSALERGARVQVLIATPEPCEWNGLKVYTDVGLEAGLIEHARPKWNKRGNTGVGDEVEVSLTPE